MIDSVAPNTSARPVPLAAVDNEPSAGWLLPAINPADSGPISCPSDATNDRLLKRWSYEARWLRLPTSVWFATTKTSWLRPRRPTKSSSTTASRANVNATAETACIAAAIARKRNGPSRSIRRPIHSARITGAIANDVATRPRVSGGIPMSRAR
jgi:hypothetical protein